MACCGGSSNIKKIVLKNHKLEPVTMEFNKALLKFDTKAGRFILAENKNISAKKSNNNPGLAEIENTKLSINRYKESIAKLKQGVAEVEQRKTKLMDMLRCDLAEKEYLEELSKAIGDYRQTIDDVKEINNRTQSVIDDKKSVHTQYLNQNHDNEDINVASSGKFFENDNNHENNEEHNYIENNQENDLRNSQPLEHHKYGAIDDIEEVGIEIENEPSTSNNIEKEENKPSNHHSNNNSKNNRNKDYVKESNYDDEFGIESEAHLAQSNIQVNPNTQSHTRLEGETLEV